MRSPVRSGAEVNLFRQALSFGAVGICATLAHISLAWLLIDLAACNPYSANLFGTCAAFVVSFLGNAGFTFRTDRSFWDSARRYLCVSLFSLAATSGILALIELNGLPTYIYAAAVFVVIPPASFLLAKLWAFSAVKPARRLCPPDPA
jgi:putative flippase GtrA